MYKTILKYLIATVLPMTICFSSAAQSPSGSENESEEAVPTAIDKIVAEAGGNVEIIVEDDLAAKILTPPELHKKRDERQSMRPGINRMQGYRIQVFSDGRNQHSLETRAKARGNAILAKFPRYRGQVYTFSSAPNWYTRVGNFTSESEAARALADLKRAFPSFANEMRVVKCKIVKIK